MKNLAWTFSFANSVVGVGVLAMPFCFQKCGLILAAVMILFYAFLTKKTCEYLLRASSSSRKSTFEQIAQFSYGDMGKLMVEMSTIALLCGTLVAFQVVIGDLAPSVVHSMFYVEKSWSLRSFLMVLSCGAILPLSLLRNISSLSSLNTISIGFYGLFISIITMMALPSLISLQWIHKINFWNSSTIFEVLPIIAMSFTCQTQVLVMYSALPDPNMLSMMEIVNSAVNLVSAIYISVGAFGYIGFHTEHISGNILENFLPGFIPQVIKFGFWCSVIISFPMLAFPVRSSLNSLLFARRNQGVLHDMISSASDYIAPHIFNMLTLGIIGGSLITGILIPKIEIVLSVTGALVGTFLSLIIPTMLFLANGAKDNTRKIAQVILVVSVFSMVFSTMSVVSSISFTQPIKPATNIKDKLITINARNEPTVDTHLKRITSTLASAQKVPDDEAKRLDDKKEVKTKGKTKVTKPPSSPPSNEGRKEKSGETLKVTKKTLVTTAKESAKETTLSSASNKLSKSNENVTAEQQKVKVDREILNN